MAGYSWQLNSLPPRHSEPLPRLFLKLVSPWLTPGLKLGSAPPDGPAVPLVRPPSLSCPTPPVGILPALAPARGRGPATRQRETCRFRAPRSRGKPGDLMVVILFLLRVSPVQGVFGVPSWSMHDTYIYIALCYTVLYCCATEFRCCVPNHRRVHR